MAFLQASGPRPPPARRAQRNLVIEHDFIADLRGFADHNTRAVIDEKALADLRAGVNFDAARQKTCELRDQAWHKRDMRFVKRVGDVMVKNSPQPLIEQRLEDIATGRVFLKND